MAFTTCSVATNNIASLDDLPNDVGGLTATELKEMFDKFGAEFVAWFNATHIVEADAHVADYVRQPGYGEATGDNDSYAITVDPVISAYAAGQMFNVKCTTANTGAATLNVCAKGAVAIKKLTSAGLVDLETGDIPTGGTISVIHNGTYWIAIGLGFGSHQVKAFSKKTAVNRDISLTADMTIDLVAGRTAKKITIDCCISSSQIGSRGYVAEDGQGCIAQIDSTGVFTQTNDGAVFIRTAGGNYNIGSVTINEGSITISWTKTGSPTGTVNMLIIAEYHD